MGTASRSNDEKTPNKAVCGRISVKGWLISLICVILLLLVKGQTYHYLHCETSPPLTDAGVDTVPLSQLSQPSNVPGAAAVPGKHSVSL